MAVEIDDLCPYKTLLLCDVPARWSFDTAVAELVNSAGTQSEVAVAPVVSSSTTRQGLTMRFFYYRVDSVPNWLLTKELKDQVNHLVVVARRQRKVAILATEPRFFNRAY